MNNFLCARTTQGMFATVFYGVLEPSGRFDFLNAGHTHPILVSAQGMVRRLDLSHLPLSLFTDVAYEPASVQLERGDQIVIFSDGVNEAQDAKGDFFGEDRLRDLVRELAGEPAQAVVSRVAAAVEDFVGPAPQADDLTLLALRFGPS